MLKNFIDDKNFFKSTEFQKFFNCSQSMVYKKIFDLNIDYTRLKGISREELNINSIFNDIFELNNKKIISPFEIDLYNKDKKLAIEYNGMMFHSFGKLEKGIIQNKDKDYHLMKTELCEEKNIELLHIMENEWLDETKKEIWKNIISNKLGLIKNRIFARKCKIKDLSKKIYNKEINNFLNKNHIQGEIPSKVKIGLYCNNELISLMTFGKPRYNKNIEWELLRFCSKLDYSVVGGASRLLNFFEINYKPKSLISYANRRWSIGNVYKKLNFKELNKTEPNYYFHIKDPFVIYHRSHFQKYKLENYLKNNEYNIKFFDKNITGMKNMFENNYRVIYDSGNRKFIKIY